ncbi:signal peptide peptidase SppA [Salisediminibacterium beveridgei]|uniref:Protease IV n=1 Tax=Salisediminibacterium beveridgei TaxID=632773 RepID=A0A1D7QT74_9BACI|nr:signal peptide peptidase SppA [Salisediminibacterium beveridgei]AOM82236.1 Protease IV [Salisediminibacterium beveridgei]
MNVKRWVALGAAVLLFVVSGFFTLGMQNFGQDFEQMMSIDREFGEQVIEQGTTPGKLAVIQVEGTIQDGGAGGLFSVGYDHQQTLRMLEHAGEDPEVHGVILQVNTPGGGVVESDELHERIVTIQEEFEKPVYAVMGGQAASGGYYISAPAEKIYANAQTFTGSIGVIIQSVNAAGLAEEWGVSLETFTSGEFKDILNPTRDITEAERELLDEIVMDSYEQFVDVVDNGRGNLSRDEVYELADGRIYTGNQAVENGLIDEIGNRNHAIEEMIEELGRGDLSVVEYGGPAGFGSLAGFGSQLMPGSEARMIEEVINSNAGARVMYLYTN